MVKARHRRTPSEDEQSIQHQRATVDSNLMEPSTHKSIPTAHSTMMAEIGAEVPNDEVEGTAPFELDFAEVEWDDDELESEEDEPKTSPKKISKPTTGTTGCKFTRKTINMYLQPTLDAAFVWNPIHRPRYTGIPSRRTTSLAVNQGTIQHSTCTPKPPTYGGKERKPITVTTMKEHLYSKHTMISFTSSASKETTPHRSFI